VIDVPVRGEAKDVLIGLNNVGGGWVRCNQNRVPQAKAKARYSLAHSGQNGKYRQEFYSSAANGDC
jgi:hypothetical protein